MTNKITDAIRAALSNDAPAPLIETPPICISGGGINDSEFIPMDVTPAGEALRCCWKCGNEIDLNDYVTRLQADGEPEGFVEFAQTWLYHRYGQVVHIESLSDIDLESEDMKPLYATYEAHVTQLQSDLADALSILKSNCGLDLETVRRIEAENNVI